MLFEDLTINYVHPGLGIGLQNIRNAWLLENKLVKLTTTPAPRQPYLSDSWLR